MEHGPIRGDLKGELQNDEFGYSVSISTNGDYIVIAQ